MLLLSALLSYAYFGGMNTDIPLFPLLALSLTEGGIFLWLVIFATERHHPTKSLVSGMMLILCIATTSLVTATSMIEYVFHLHNVIAAYATGATDVVLCVMLMAHMLALVSTPVIGKLEFNSQHGNLIPTSGNLIPAQTQVNEEFNSQEGGETDNPLDSIPQPQYTPVSLPSVGTLVNGAVNLVTRKGRGSNKNTSTAVPVPGQTNGTIGASTSTSESGN